VYLQRQALLDLAPQLRDLDPGDHILEECPLQQPLRDLGLEAARQQVEQHALVELAGGGAVAAAYLVGVDLQLRSHVEFGFRAGEQSAQRLTRIRPGRVLAHHDLAVERDARASGGNSAKHLFGARARRGMLDRA